jgi:hypothetical protein
MQLLAVTKTVRCICIAKPIEGKIFLMRLTRFLYHKANTGALKDWNDSGGQRPPQKSTMIVLFVSLISIFEPELNSSAIIRELHFITF